jgi:hypothetical protein
MYLYSFSNTNTDAMCPYLVAINFSYQLLHIFSIYIRSCSSLHQTNTSIGLFHQKFHQLPVILITEH